MMLVYIKFTYSWLVQQNDARPIGWLILRKSWSAVTKSHWRWVTFIRCRWRSPRCYKCIQFNLNHNIVITVYNSILSWLTINEAFISRSREIRPRPQAEVFPESRDIYVEVMSVSHDVMLYQKCSSNFYLEQCLRQRHFRRDHSSLLIFLHIMHNTQNQIEIYHNIPPWM